MKKNPFPNEHSARQTEPDPKIYKTYRRSTSFKNYLLPAGISIIYGIRRAKGPRGGVSEIQSIRFNKNLWTPTKAKKWLKTNKLKSTNFESAKIKKIRKNPVVDRRLINDFVFILINDSVPISFISSTINYYYVGYQCKDCKEYFEDCKCEGDQIHFDDPENLIGNYPCRYCRQNRCICDLKINENDSSFKIKTAVLNWLKTHLSNKEIEKIRQQAIEFLNKNKVFTKKPISSLTLDDIIKLTSR